MASLRELLKADELSPTHAAIAGYILNNPEEVSRISSRELARRTFTSPSAVLRYCKRIGFTNFNDLKVNIVSELKSVDLATTLVDEGESAVAVCNKIASLERQVVDETMRKVSPATLEAIAERVAACRYVDILAFDTNAEIARYASHNLALTGKICTVYDNLDKMAYLALTIPADHVVFLISRSGRDETLHVVATLLRQRGTTTVAMTAEARSPLARACTHTVEGFYFGDFEKLGDVVFSGAMKYLFDVLFVLAYAKDANRVRQLNSRYDQLYYSKLDRSKGESA